MESLSWLFYTIAWLATIVLLSKAVNLRHRVNLPPGPKPWPVIGNFNLISALPHRSIHDLSKKYGPLMHIKLGSRSVIVASSIEFAKEFLRTNDVVLAGRPMNAAAKYTIYNNSDILWAQYGSYWRHARKLCVLELFSAKQVQFYEYIRVEETRALMQGLYNFSGKTISLRSHLAHMTLSVISRIVCGKKYTVKTDGEACFIKPSEFKEMLEELFLLNGVFNIGDYMPWLGFLDLQGYVKRMKAVSKKIDRFLENVIDEHNQRRNSVKDWVAMDMVDVLLQMADSQNLEFKLDRTCVKAITLDLIAGGTQSSSVTLEWAIAELLKNPTVLKKATEELDRVIGRERWVEEKDMPQLPFMEGIVKETMRLHPVAPMLVPRQAREDCKVTGFDIPAGTVAYVSVWSIGRDPALWEKPAEFNPERFIGKRIDVKGADFQLLPFGAGRRMCPAYPLGLKIIQSNLANLLHGFSWNLTNGLKPEDLDMGEVFGLSTPKKYPLEAIVEPRLPSHLYYQ